MDVASSAGWFCCNMERNGIYKLGFATGSTLHYWLGDVTVVKKAVQSIPSLPHRYISWWKEMVRSDPVHVCIETILISFVVYMIFSSRKQQQKKLNFDRREKLTKEEEDELLKEWKETGRSPLAPPLSTLPENSKTTTNDVVVSKVEGPYVYVKDKKLLNFGTHDFLGMSNDKSVKEAARQTLENYGCGSCGPRGFYGTIDSHLHLEEAVSKTMNTDEAIMYSDGASAATSTVAAFAKRGDLLVVDEGIYEALGTGVALSRANIKYFRHNDMDDLRRVLERVHATDQQIKRKSSEQRRFIVVEGLYKNYGTIAPLDKIIALKEEFAYRLIVDESYAFGTLGETGKGTIEMFGVKPMRDVEIITFSLENSIGSVGGVTVGSEEVVDHQRLSGAGYCFSASCPPFLATAAMTSIQKMESADGKARIKELHNNVNYFYSNFKPTDEYQIISNVSSPLVILQFSKDIQKSKKFAEQTQLFDQVVSICMDKGVALISTGGHVKHHIHRVPAPAIRLTISCLQTSKDIQTAIDTLQYALRTVLKN